MAQRQLSKSQYETLAAFRYALRRFFHFSEQAAQSAGITPQQHQALLAIKGFPGRDWVRRSILTEKLARRGQHISREYGVDLFELTRVGDVMDKDLPTIPMDMKVWQLSDLIARGDSIVAQRQGTLIMDKENRLAGIITRGDVVRALRSDPFGNMTVSDAGKHELAVTYADELLHDALGTMLKHDVGRLPVVDREHPDRVVGYLGRASILAARLRHHQEEEIREGGGLLRGLTPKLIQRQM